MIASTSLVYIWVINAQTGQRAWVSKVENAQSKVTGQIKLVPIFDDDFHAAQKFEFGYAVLARRRFNSEGAVNSGRYFFSLSPDGEEVGAEDAVGSSSLRDDRVSMSYRGLRAVPGFETKTQRKCWYVRFPNKGIESVRGDSPESAVNQVFERGGDFLRFAERAEPAEQPKEEKKEVTPGPQLRPGDLRGKEKK
jgi:hypothetical protein